MSHDEKRRFDLLTFGTGIASRFRWSTSGSDRSFAPFWAITITAFRGNSDSPEHTLYNVKVVNEEIIDLLQRYRSMINDDDTEVLLGFCIDGESPELTTIYHKRLQRSTTRVSMVGRLVGLSFIRIRHGDEGYRTVYRRASRFEHDDTSVNHPDGSTRGFSTTVPLTASAMNGAVANERIDTLMDETRTATPPHPTSTMSEESIGALQDVGRRFREELGEPANDRIDDDSFGKRKRPSETAAA